jgi:hypothetical protein
MNPVDDEQLSGIFSGIRMGLAPTFGGEATKLYEPVS